MVILTYQFLQCTGYVTHFAALWRPRSHPGPITKNAAVLKPKCAECSRTVAKNQKHLCCSECSQYTHAKCINIKNKVVNSTEWICYSCALPNFLESLFNESDSNLHVTCDEMNSSTEKSSERATITEELSIEMQKKLKKIYESRI